jgi:hypothetical protein
MATRRKRGSASPLHTELAALKAELEKLEPVLPVEAVKRAGADMVSDVESLLGQVREGLGETGDDLEKAIVEHPLTAVALAFAAGYVIARLTGR